MTEPALPPDLEARIVALQDAATDSGFDAASWVWMIILGVAIPLVLLAVGWWS